eukprot:366124-Chlamydomonas_euryale.AAC.9
MFTLYRSKQTGQHRPRLMSRVRQRIRLAAVECSLFMRKAPVPCLRRASRVQPTVRTVIMWASCHILASPRLYSSGTCNNM